MRRMSVVATLTVAFCLTMAASAFAHHVDVTASNATCTGLTVQFVGFKPSDGPVNWIVTVNGQPNTSGAFNAFSGNKTFTQAYSPGPLTGPGPYTVVFRADWPTKGNNNGTFSKTVTGCPPATPTPPKLPCPDQPPTAPCNCPPGPAGPPGVNTNTTITVVEKHETVVYVEKTCTSARVFHLTIPKRLSRSSEFDKRDRGQRIASARIVWRGADANHKTVTKKKTAKLKNGRLKVDADFRGSIAVPGQERVIDEYLKLANGRTVHLTREVRLCMFRDGDLNAPTDLPQNGRADGAGADAARAAKAKDPKYRKAVI